jgi:ElaB/YqjD/DUF883 family membrane-anchored ribosome-binding protein
MKTTALDDDRNRAGSFTELPREIQSWAAAQTAEVRDAAASIKPRLREASATAERQMRERPVRWTGVAVAAGIVLGIAGRLLVRGRRRRHPSIVIIG